MTPGSADSPLGPLTVDGGITIAVDTASVRRLSAVLGEVSQEVIDAGVGLLRAGLLAQPQMLASAPLSPLTALHVSVALGEAASRGAALAWSLGNLGREVDRVAAAYDQVEGRAVELLRGDFGYHSAAAFLAEAFSPRTAHVSRARELNGRPAPVGIAELANWFEGYQRDEPGGPGRIDVIARTMPDTPGRQPRTAYTVLFAGTSSLLPPGQEARRSDVRNLSANLRLASGQSTPEVAALPEALARAGVPADAELTFVGHSQGGMTALMAANDSAVAAAYRVRHVITFGSPVARMPVPQDIWVLSVENRGDPVPSLDFAPNQASARHVTVQAGLDRPGVHGADDHSMQRYLPAAQQIDASDHPSLVAFNHELRQTGVLAHIGPGDRDRVAVRRVEVSLPTVPPPASPLCLSYDLSDNQR